MVRGSGATFSTRLVPARGVRADLGHADHTNVHGSSSTSRSATISISAGSQSLANVVGGGAATVKATDPSSLIQGAVALALTPEVLSPPPGSTASSYPVLSVVPGSDRKRTTVVAHGAHLAPGASSDRKKFTRLGRSGS